MIVRLIPRFVLLWLHFSSCNTEDVCPQGWFGSTCQFKCHCGSPCNSYGQCVGNDKCSNGWFGNTCQYQDLLSTYSTIRGNLTNKSQYAWLTDGNDSTCNPDDDLKSIEISFNTSLPVTWLRISLSNIVFFGSLTVTFGPGKATNDCIYKNIYIINRTTVDIRCSLNVASVIIGGQGLKELCSFYISGGRNVALKQVTSQSTTYGNSTASKAVDGNTSGKFDDLSCTHNSFSVTDNKPTWNVTFAPDQVLNRVILYNRNDNDCNGQCGHRLYKFNLQIYDSNNNLVFNYKDNSSDTEDISVFPVMLTKEGSTKPVKVLSISLDKINSTLTLCEVEAYGDCEQDKWGIYCNNSCNMTCNTTCNAETGSCPVCNGFQDPPNCKSMCTTGTWGINCSNNCYSSCWDNSCNNIVGTCDKGCNGSSDFPNCKTECVHGLWGPNCSRTCSSSCFNSSCNRLTGVCNRGCIGYNDVPTCITACTTGTWGINCSYNCSSSCWENSCNNAVGACDRGCNGSSDFPTCKKECNSTYWGPNCTTACNLGCFNSSCDRHNGLCIYGCNGYIDPPHCIQSCDEGYWGHHCKNKCSTKCWNKSCNHVTGVCDRGCNGYQDSPHCIKECDKGKWGHDCTNTCRTNCWKKSCNHVTGWCDQGCNGYQDFPNCTKECDPGVSGLNCTNYCENCYNKSCNSQSGLCDIGCNGYSDPPYCNMSCDIGLWGLNCTETCKENCFNTSCNQKNGTCDQGCNGYNDPPFCNIICSSGLWGIDCSKKCPEKCWNETCNHMNGQCYQGCNGYKNPPLCNEECGSGYWSINCTASCSVGCFNTSCHRQTRECHQGCHAGYLPPNCEQGCTKGYFGINCSTPCSSNCSESICLPTVGHCLNCDDKHTGNFCEALVAETTETPIGAIVGPIIAVIAVSALIFAGVMFWRRLRAFKGDKSGDADDTIETKRLSNSYQRSASAIRKKDQEFNEEDVTDNSSTQGVYNNEGTYANLHNTSIAVNDLYSFMHSHNKEYFEQMFKNIPVPKNVSTEVGMSSLNVHKNRYKNICTYDHSRVHLEINTAKNEGDYINASYIKGPKKQDQFIASQGPSHITLNDFVRMLWEQQVDKVVMLTNLIEEGTVKCEKYWPDDGTKEFGEIQMKMISTHTFADYTIRNLELSKPNEAGRTFTQFHFTSWPDKGVPAAPWGLVDFEQRVSAKPTSKPTVVHCSAGVGRTGTFIALSNVIREAEETGRIDFFQAVTRLRQDRVLMVQTAEQYRFLHKAAEVAIVCIGTTVTSNDIVRRIKHLGEKTTTGQTKLEEEFHAVCNVCNEFVEEPQEVVDSTTEDGNVYNNIEEITDRSKNRCVSIIPKQKYRPFLSCENQNMGDYINAVFLPGFKKKDQQLLTQLPMPKTVVDFWRLVTQYKISLIVAFELDVMGKDETFGPYLPASVNKTLYCSPYLIKVNNIKSSPSCEEQKLTVEIEKQKSLLSLSSSERSNQSVIHLKCLFTDLDPVKLLQFIRQIRSYNALADGRILYTCSNGAKYSGLACVLSLLLDRMEHDSCLTIPLVVGTVKTIRPEVIPTMEQYRVLYDVLQRYTNNSVQYESLLSVAGKNTILSTTSNPAFDETQDQDSNIYANL